jgi:hypothetical protein
MQRRWQRADGNVCVTEVGVAGWIPHAFGASLLDFGSRFAWQLPDETDDFADCEPRESLPLVSFGTPRVRRIN